MPNVTRVKINAYRAAKALLKPIERASATTTRWVIETRIKKSDRMIVLLKEEIERMEALERFDSPINWSQAAVDTRDRSLTDTSTVFVANTAGVIEPHELTR